MLTIWPNEVAKFLFCFSTETSSSLPTQKESGLGVIEYDGLKETLEKKSRKELILKLRKKNVSLLANIPPYMVPVLPYESLESLILIWNLDKAKQEY